MNPCNLDISSVISYAHKISFNTSCPLGGWDPSQPLGRMTTPYPSDELLRRSILYEAVAIDVNDQDLEGQGNIRNFIYVYITLVVMYQVYMFYLHTHMSVTTMLRYKSTCIIYILICILTYTGYLFSCR